MSKRIVLVAALIAVAGLAVSAATAAAKKQKVKTSSHMLVGINDEADTLYGDPVSAFATLKELKTQVLRVNLYWGGTKWAVANSGRPKDPTDPGDPAYNWALYDRLVKYAQTNDIQLVFSILFTPGWANGGKSRTTPPKDFTDLENFAYAAAERYSGLWIPPSWQLQPQLRDAGRASRFGDGLRGTGGKVADPSAVRRTGCHRFGVGHAGGRERVQHVERGIGW